VPVYPRTPDGRYFVVRGRLWQTSNPALPVDERQRLVSDLMAGRRAVREALRSGTGLAKARQQVDQAKVALGERGPVWWSDGSPDLNRYMARNTPYAQWFASLETPEAPAASAIEAAQSGIDRPG